MRDSQKGRQGERLINMSRPPDSRRTSDVAVWDVEGGWTLFMESQPFENLLIPKRDKEVTEMLALKGSCGWDIGHLSRNQSTRVGQVLGEQGLLMSYYIFLKSS